MAEEIKYEEYNDRFDEFFEEVKRNGTYDSDLILKAYKLARDAHKDQRRRSGEPYIMHPVAVAKILFEIGMDNDCIVSALLHDVVEDTGYDLDYIRNEFGQSSVRFRFQPARKFRRRISVRCSLQ